MKHTTRILSALLALCLSLTVLFPVAASAADVTEITVSALAEASAAYATQLETAITKGTKDGKGIYYDFTFPGKLTSGSTTLNTEVYTLLAAHALCELADGKAKTTTLVAGEVSFNTSVVSCGSGTTLTKGQYLDLASRAADFGDTLSYLPHSFNRPSDGTNTYDGRIAVYSLPLIFARALASYASNGKLPDSITFVPTHVTNGTAIVDPTEAPAESSTTAPTAAPTEAPTAAPTEPDGITVSVLALEGYQIEAFVKENYATPNYCTLSTNDVVYPAQMLYLMCQAIVDISNGSTTNSYDIPTMNEAGNPNGSVTAGSITKSEYITLASNVITFMNKNSTAPNYCTSSLGTIEFDAAFYFFACILSEYYETKALPASEKVANFDVTIGNLGGTSSSTSSGSATFGADYSAYSAYTVPTSNCQSKNATIIAVAQTGMKYSSGSHGGYANPTNTYQAMFNLMEYLNAKTSYSYYSNTSKGALGTWNAKSGNCCDMAHLMNACARSLGVPARYRHGYCVFSSGLKTGHVWSEVYCGSSYGWKTADLVSAYNYLGYKTSTTSYYMSGDKTITLPF